MPKKESGRKGGSSPRRKPSRAGKMPFFSVLNVPQKELFKVAQSRHHGHGGDFRESMPWRIFRIMAELIDGFQSIADFKTSVTIFGSARAGENTKWYKEARKLGSMLGKAGFAVVTGGGPGIMEAGNRGVTDAGGNSIGLNIQLPYEQRLNPYVNRAIGFHYFFTRKLMLSYSAEAYVYFPGGFGTLDEFFEVITLIQTRKITTHIPVILVGKEYWEPLTEWIDDRLLRMYNTIDKEDTSIYSVVDSAEEAMRIIKKRAKPRDEFTERV